MNQANAAVACMFATMLHLRSNPFRWAVVMIFFDNAVECSGCNKTNDLSSKIPTLYTFLLERNGTFRNQAVTGLEFAWAA